MMSGSNCSYLEEISMVPKMSELLKCDHLQYVLKACVGPDQTAHM